MIELMRAFYLFLIPQSIFLHHIQRDAYLAYPRNKNKNVLVLVMPKVSK